MHRLYLLRHAEAALVRPGGADIDRTLTAAGRAAAEALGARLRAEGHPAPHFVLCSNARRTQETWQAFSAGLAAPAVETLQAPEIYRGGPRACMTLIAAVPTQGPVLLVGHNPVITELAHVLVGEAVQPLPPSLPTAGLAVIDFAEPLSHIARRKGRLTAFLQPS